MKLRRLLDQDGQPRGWGHFCPGCKSIHYIYVERPGYTSNAKWGFNGNVEKPTFTPSVLLYTTLKAGKSTEVWKLKKDGVKRREEYSSKEEAENAASGLEPGWIPVRRVRFQEGGGRKTLCHYHLVDGVIRYLADSAHSLAGQNVPLSEIPEEWL